MPPHEDDLLRALAGVRRLAVALVADEATADDLVQDTWLVARASARRPSGAPLGRWLRGVLRHLAARHARGEARRAAREVAAARPEAGPDTAGSEAAGGYGDVLARGSLQAELAAALEALPEGLRAAVILRYLDGLTGPEVAARLQISPAAARQRITRALAALRVSLDTRHGGDRRAWAALVPGAWSTAGAGAEAVSAALPVRAVASLAISSIMSSKSIIAGAALCVAVLGVALLGRGARPVTAPLQLGDDAPAALGSLASAEEAGRPSHAARLEGAPTDAAARPEPVLRVVDEAGAPCVGFGVALRAAQGWRAVGQTDAAGEVELPEDRAERDGAVHAWLGRADHRASALRVELAPEGQVSVAVLPRGFVVGGHIVDTALAASLRLECDRPLENTDAAAVPRAAGLHPSPLAALRALGLDPDTLQARTEGGTFQFAGLARDWTGALVAPPEVVLESASAGDLVGDGRTLLLLEPTPDLALHLAEPALVTLAVRGRAVSSSGTPLRDARLEVGWRGPRGAPGAASATADGQLALTLAVERRTLRGGVLAAVVSAEGHEDLQRLVHVDAPERPVDLGTLTLAPARPRSGLDPSRSGGLAVRVSADGGALPDGLTLEVSAASELVAGAPARSLVLAVDDGRAEVAGLRPGLEVELVVVGPLGEPLARAFAVTPTRGAAKRVELVVGGTEAPRARRGRVVDASGRGLPRCTVHAERDGAALEAVTDADGEFSLARHTDAAPVDHLEVTRAGFVTAVFADVTWPTDGAPFVVTLERGRTLVVEVRDLTGAPAEGADVHVVVGARTVVPGDDSEAAPGTLEVPAVPFGPGTVTVSLGGREFTTPIGAAETTVRCLVPKLGTLVVTLAAGHVDAAVRESRAAWLLVLQPSDDADGRGDGEARQRFTASEDGLAPLVMTLPEGRYLARLERRALGAGLPRRLETHDLGTLEVRGGERLERVVP